MRVDQHQGDDRRAFFAQLCCTERLEKRPADARCESIEQLSFSLLRSFIEVPDTACRELLDRAAKECVAELVGILTQESTKGRIRYRWSFGVGSLAGQEKDWMQPEECPSSLVLEKKEPQLFFGNGRTDFFSNKIPISFHEALAIPFLWEGRESGALWVIRQSNHTPFHLGDVRWLSALADVFQVATQASRASRYLEENRLRLRWVEELVPPQSGDSAIREWVDALLGQILRITEAESVRLYLRESSEKQLFLEKQLRAQQEESTVREMVSEPPAAVDLAIEKGEVVFIGNGGGAVAGGGACCPQSTDPPCDQTHLAIPLTVAEGKVLGALAVCSSSTWSPDPTDLSWICLMVRQMASGIALERLRGCEQSHEKRFRLLASALGAVTWNCSASGQQEFPPQGWIAYNGQSAEELLGDSWTKMVHPDDLASAVTKWNSSVKQGVPFANEHRLRGRDQQWHWSSVHAVPVRNDEGVIQEWLGFCFNITSPRQSEWAALESQGKLRAAIECMSDAVLITDEQGNPLEFNQAFVDFHRFSSRPEVFAKLKIYDSTFGLTMLQGQPVGMEEGVVHRALRGERIKEMEYAIHRTDRAETWIGCFSANPILDAQQAVKGCVMVVHDVTARKQIERELRDRDAMLQAILKAASDAILVLDREERIFAINPGGEAMFGCAGQELVGKSAAGLIPSSVRSSVGQSFRRYLQKLALRRNGGVQEAMLMRCDGRQFPAEISLVGIAEDERCAVFIRDLTERRELQRRVLRAATDEQRRIGQELHDGIQQELTGLALFASAVNHVIDQIGSSEDQMAAVPSTPSTTREAPLLDKLHAISQKLTEGLAEAQKHVQALARGILASPVRADDLPEALKKLTETVGPEISFEFVGGGQVRISDDTAASHLYRIAQEAINNAIRHGKASRIKVLLQALQDHVRLEVSDNGNGFHPSANGDGVGLRTMEYRVQLMNGVFQIEPIPGGGTIIRCVLPAAHHVSEENCDEIKASIPTFPPTNPDGALE